MDYNPIRPHIVFVHIGPLLPLHLEVAIGQARRFNNCDIWLIAPTRALEKAALSPDVQLRTVSCEALGLSDIHGRFHRVARLDRHFRSGFWLHTTERFFYLQTLVDRAGLRHVFHLENDVMLYADLLALLPIFTRCYPAMAATFDAPNRCVPGFVYARNLAALDKLTRFIVDVAASTEKTPNDMALLAGFRSVFGNRAVDTLPIIPDRCPHLVGDRLGPDPLQAGAFWKYFDQFDAIFDAAAIGQYLGGVDPRNADGMETVGFINETCIFDPSGYQYRWHLDSRGRRVPYAVDQGREYRVNNLHIHSKALGSFVS